VPDQADSIDARVESSARTRLGAGFQSRLPRLVGAAGILAGFIGWELYGRAQETNLFVPTVGETLGALSRLVTMGEFWTSYQQTLVPFLYGWVAALIVGVALGLVIGQSGIARRLSAPYVAFLNALPISTLVPLVVVAMGIGILARSIVVFLFAIVEVLLSTAAGVRYIGDDINEMSRSFGMTGVKRFRRVVLPGAMPGIMAGVRVGTGRAVVGMVVVELLLVSVGVGKLINRFRSGFTSPELYAVVLTLAIIGLGVLAAVRRLEVYALRWRPGG
jgi:ABC-type nitrate/sulfonate/bicarbonate transport system permease component